MMSIKNLAIVRWNMMNQEVNFHEFCYCCPFRNEKDNNNMVKIYKVDESDTEYLKKKKFCIPRPAWMLQKQPLCKSGSDDWLCS